MVSLLRSFSLQELRHHPWRNAAAVVAVMLGVALAFSVHLINASALSEFSSAVRSAGGQPDLELRAMQGAFDETLYAQVATHPQVSMASPVLELSTIAVVDGKRPQQLRIVGVDALVVRAVAPALMPVPVRDADRFAIFAPRQLFLNPAAQLALRGADGVQLQSGGARVETGIAGTVAAEGAALAVMDLGAAQDLFARHGQLTRIDVRLRPGVDRAAFVRSLALPAGVVVAQPADTASQVNSLSRAYRVNLTVLALVALFTGAFLVYSVLALSVARRSQQFALLGVLGVTAPQRRRLVLAESLVLGAIGSACGIALGTALAALGLRWLGGDLGGGYFSGIAPDLQWTAPAALMYASLGVVAAAAGGWLPALAAQRLPLAQTLKGLGTGLPRSRKHWVGLGMVLAGAALALLPPVQGIPLGAYLSVGLLLVGGISVLPWLIAGIYDAIAPALSAMLLPMLAVERARRVRESAAIAVSGVVASLSLAVALTVMVASFRESVSQWLDVVLPADLYSRTSTSSSAGDTVFFPASFIRSVEQVPGVRRVTAQRSRQLLLDPALPPVSLLARTLDDPGKTLPLVGDLHPAPPGQIAIFVSEAVVDLYGAKGGAPFAPLEKAFATSGKTFHVAGVWRDYVRQSGAIAMSRTDYEQMTGDTRINDFQLWLAPGAQSADVQGAIRELAEGEAGLAGVVEFASAQELRAVSLRIFDRSFAVTYWLQAVAIGIGLFAVAASFSAQVLARRKEFGLLSHLGLTRRQILGVVAGEGLAWTAIGSLAGLVLGLAVAVVLVHVVNPQSFHWTMDLLVPWIRLLALCAAVIAAGTITAWLAGRAAAGRDTVLAVKEDW
ncbi:MAG: FtsX-like permease family protein [Pseudomonadota bacterium]